MEKILQIRRVYKITMHFVYKNDEKYILHHYFLENWSKQL